MTVQHITSELVDNFGDWELVTTVDKQDNEQMLFLRQTTASNPLIGLAFYCYLNQRDDVLLQWYCTKPLDIYKRLRISGPNLKTKYVSPLPGQWPLLPDTPAQWIFDAFHCDNGLIELGLLDEETEHLIQFASKGFDEAWQAFQHLKNVSAETIP